MNIEKTIEEGHVLEALLGEGSFYVESRYFSGHDHLLVIYWLNEIAKKQESLKERYAAQIMMAVGILCKKKKYSDVADIAVAISVKSENDDWVLPLSLAEIVESRSDILDHLFPYVSSDFFRKAEELVRKGG